jgi:hypothetical protein
MSKNEIQVNKIAAPEKRGAGVLALVQVVVDQVELSQVEQRGLVIGVKLRPVLHTSYWWVCLQKLFHSYIQKGIRYLSCQWDICRLKMFTKGAMFVFPTSKMLIIQKS